MDTKSITEALILSGIIKRATKTVYYYNVSGVNDPRPRFF